MSHCMMLRPIFFLCIFQILQFGEATIKDLFLSDHGKQQKQEILETSERAQDFLSKWKKDAALFIQDMSFIEGCVQQITDLNSKALNDLQPGIKSTFSFLKDYDKEEKEYLIAFQHDKDVAKALSDCDRKIVQKVLRAIDEAALTKSKLPTLQHNSLNLLYLKTQITQKAINAMTDIGIFKSWEGSLRMEFLNKVNNIYSDARRELNHLFDMFVWCETKWKSVKEHPFNIAGDYKNAVKIRQCSSIITVDINIGIVLNTTTERLGDTLFGLHEEISKMQTTASEHVDMTFVEDRDEIKDSLKRNRDIAINSFPDWLRSHYPEGKEQEELVEKFRDDMMILADSHLNLYDKEMVLAKSCVLIFKQITKYQNLKEIKFYYIQELKRSSPREDFPNKDLSEFKLDLRYDESELGKCSDILKKDTRHYLIRGEFDCLKLEGIYESEYTLYIRNKQTGNEMEELKKKLIIEVENVVHAFSHALKNDDKDYSSDFTTVIISEQRRTTENIFKENMKLLNCGQEVKEFLTSKEIGKTVRDECIEIPPFNLNYLTEQLKTYRLNLYDELFVFLKNDLPVIIMHQSNRLKKYIQVLEEYLSNPDFIVPQIRKELNHYFFVMFKNDCLPKEEEKVEILEKSSKMILAMLSSTRKTFQVCLENHEKLLPDVASNLHPSVENWVLIQNKIEKLCTNCRDVFGKLSEKDLSDDSFENIVIKHHENLFESMATTINDYVDTFLRKDIEDTMKMIHKHLLEIKESKEASKNSLDLYRNTIIPWFIESRNICCEAGLEEHCRWLEEQSHSTSFAVTVDSHYETVSKSFLDNMVFCEKYFEEITSKFHCLRKVLMNVEAHRMEIMFYFDSQSQNVQKRLTERLNNIEVDYAEIKISRAKKFYLEEVKKIEENQSESFSGIFGNTTAKLIALGVQNVSIPSSYGDLYESITAEWTPKENRIQEIKQLSQISALRLAAAAFSLTDDSIMSALEELQLNLKTIQLAENLRKDDMKWTNRFKNIFRPSKKDSSQPTKLKRRHKDSPLKSFSDKLPWKKVRDPGSAQTV